MSRLLEVVEPEKHRVILSQWKTCFTIGRVAELLSRASQAVPVFE